MEAETGDVGEGCIRRDSGVDFSDDGGHGSMSHEDDEEEENANDGPAAMAATKKANKKQKKKKSHQRIGKVAEFEFKSGLIFDLEM